MEFEERSEQLEREAERLEQESKRVGGRIQETRGDWEAKEQDSQVPGAMEPEDAEESEEDEQSEAGQ